MKTVFPEDLKALSIENLESLKVEALAEFDTLWKDDFALIPEEDSTALAAITDGVKAVDAELASRAAAAQRFADMKSSRDAAFETITINSGTLDADVTPDPTDATDPAAAAATDVTPGGDSTLTAASERPAAAALSIVPQDTPEAEPAVAFATGEGLGVPQGTDLNWMELGAALEKKLERHTPTVYANAARAKQVLRKTDNFAAFRKGMNLPKDQQIEDGASKGAVRRAIEAARDQSKLSGGSLIASGGWGAPSNISYDRFPKLSSQDGLATFPEVGVTHGGLQMPHGSTFAGIYADLGTEVISFTEQQDIDGAYHLTDSGANVEGTKPIYRIPPTEWVDYRLRVDGIHIQAGILENKGYPEGIAEETAMVMDAHAHLINAKVIAAAVAGSTAAPAIAAQVSAAAPILGMVEMQVTHYRDTHRMSFGTTLEAKAPFWIAGVFRADLSRRLGLDGDQAFNITDADVKSWFAMRGVSLEYVYDWQSIAGNSIASFNQWPTSVSILLYAAGTWVKGTSDVISLDTMYDSTLLGTNDYTVLFTEEGWFLAKAGPDSRVVTINFQANGATHIGEEIARSGAAS